MATPDPHAARALLMMAVPGAGPTIADAAWADAYLNREPFTTGDVSGASGLPLEQ